MKTKMNIWILAGTFLWAPLCMAQDQGPQRGQNMRNNNGQDQRMGPKGKRRGYSREMKQRIEKMRSKLLRNRVGLSEERARKVEQVFERFEPTHKKVRKQLRMAKKSLRELIRSNSQDNAAYDKALEDMRNARIGMDNFHDQINGALKVEMNGRERAILFMAMKRMQQRIKQRMRGGGKGNRGERGPRGRRGQWEQRNQ